MNTDRYLLDTNALKRLNRTERTSDFVARYCRIPSEVLYEARALPDLELLRRLEYKTDAKLLQDLRAVMATIDPTDFNLVDLYHNHGNADPILIAAAVHATRLPEAELFPDRWLIVTDDRPLTSKAADWNIKTLTLPEFKATIAGWLQQAFTFRGGTSTDAKS